MARVALPRSRGVRVEGGTIDFIQSIHLEEKGKYEDHWRLGPKRHELTFDFKTDRGVDGINFEVSTEAKVIHFNLHIDGKHHADKIFIGKGNHHPGSDPFNSIDRMNSSSAPAKSQS